MNIIDVNEVSKKTTLSRSSVYAYAAAGKFPASVRLGSRQVGWVESEVEAWLEERVKNHRTAQHLKEVTA